MKKLTAIIAMFFAGSAAAQTTELVWVMPEKELTIVNESFNQWVDSVTVTKEGSRFVNNGFWDNWFLQAGVGAQVYFGQQDSHAALKSRITPVFDLSLGKWLNPAYGLRVQAGGWKVKGFSTDINAYTVGEPCEEGYYTQKWDQFYVHGDFMLNLSNAIWGYRADRFYNLQPYIGAGYAQAVNADRGNRSALFAAGVINSFRLCDNFDVNVEVKASAVTDDYDDQSSRRIADCFASASVGLTWKIGKKAGPRPFHREMRANTYITRVYKPDVQVVKEVVVEQKIVECPSSDVLNTQVAIFFDIESAHITERGKLNVSYAADMIKAGEGKFRIVGMADSNTGPKAFNQKLSEKRAEAVRDLLVNQYGVSADKLIVEALGGVDYQKPGYVNRSVIIRPE